MFRFEAAPWSTWDRGSLPNYMEGRKGKEQVDASDALLTKECVSWLWPGPAAGTQAALADTSLIHGNKTSET